MKQILEYTFWNNTVKDYLITLAVMLAIIGFVRFVRTIALKKLKQLAVQTDSMLDDLLLQLFEKSILPIINVGALFAASHYLTLPPKVDRILYATIAVLLTFFVARLIVAAIKTALDHYLEKQENAEEKKRQVRSLLMIVKIFVWLLALLFLFSNLGYDITAIVTGLGIGGIAIALAAQTILGDLFSYFVIFFDRPFEIGDFITVDDKRGTVEYIGLKTTRIRSLTGEMLVVSNTNLTNSRVHNFKKMERRRIVFTLGVTYQTPAEKLRQIPSIIKDAIENTPGTTFDRAHFSAFADFSLNFEVVYFIDDADIKVYMDAHQQINLSIYQAFEQQGIEFAYPTQTIYLETGQHTPQVAGGA